MDEIIAKTIEKLEETGACLKDSRVFQQVYEGDDESVLDREKRLLREKKAREKERREEAIRKAEGQGFSALRPKIQPNEDYETKCEPTEPRDDSKKIPIFGPNPNKPQNRSPYDLTADRRRFYDAPSETKGIVIPLDQPYEPDRTIRAKLAANWKSELPEVIPERKPISSVLPQMPYQNENTLTEEEKLAKKYLYTSTYQANYGMPKYEWKSKFRVLHPLRTLELLPDPLRKISGSSEYHPPTKTWQPENFNKEAFDASLSRFDHFNESRPYEFTTHAPRIDQIPSYSGSYGTDDKRVEVDDPYKIYRPLNKVRSLVPSRPFLNPQENILGYTGCVVDHVRQAGNPPWPWESVRGFF